MAQTLLKPTELEDQFLLPEHTLTHPERVIRETRERTGSLFDLVKSGLQHLRAMLGSVFSPAPKGHQKPEHPKRLSLEEHTEEGWVPYDELRE